MAGVVEARRLSMALTVRDEEILRALCRVKVAPTRAFVGRYFGNLRVAQRRISVLRDMCMVTQHHQVLTLRAGACREAFWRLTPAGADVVAAVFPDEPEVMQRMRRAQKMKLTSHQHHMALVDLYLSVGPALDPKKARAKASSFIFRADREVRLPYTRVAKRAEVVPDATYYSTSGGPVVFIEMDRSTHTHKRIARSVEGYVRALRDGALAEALPQVVGTSCRLIYSTKTARRAESLRRTVARLDLDGLDVVFLDAPGAERLLHQALHGCNPDAPYKLPPSADDGTRTRSLIRNLYDELVAYGQHSEALEQAYAYLQEAS